jgi:hypothetical protein
MRFREIKLFEFAPPTTDQIDLVGPLEQILNDTEPNDPKHQEALKVLQSIIQIGNAPTAVQNQTTPTQATTAPPVTTPAPTANVKPIPGQAPVDNRHPEVRNVIGKEPNQQVSEDLAGSEEQLVKRARIAQPKITPKKLDELLKLYPWLADEFQNRENQGVKKGEEQATQQQAEFEVALNTKVNRLIDKVFNTLEILPTDKELEGKKVENADKVAAAKKAKDYTQTRKSATRIVKGIIADLVEVGGDPEVRKQKRQNVLSFIEKLEVGIIDMDALLMTPQSNLDAYVDKSDPIMLEFYHEIVEELIGSAPITTAGAWGPAELALAVLGKPASKSQDKGDVQVGVHKIEVKSSQKGSSGGRIGGNGVNNGSSMKSKWIALLKEYIPGIFGNAVSLNYDDPNYLLAFHTKDENGETKMVTPKAKKGEPKPEPRPAVTKTTLTGVNQNFFKSWNQKVEEAGGVDGEVVREFVLELIKIGIKEDYHALIPENAVRSTVDDSGYIDYPKLWHQYALAAFKAYQVADGVSTIMMINSNTRSYTLFKDSKQLSKLLNKGVVKANSTMMAFSDQTSLGPQMGIS